MMKNGIRSLASPMSWTGPTQIVCQRLALEVMEHPLLRQSLVRKAAIRTTVPKWWSWQDTRKCTKRLTAKQARGRANQPKHGKMASVATVAASSTSTAHKRQARERKWSSKKKNPKRTGSRQFLEVHRQVHKALCYGEGSWDKSCASFPLKTWRLKGKW